MVDGQIRTFDVTEHRVVQAFLEVAREEFLPDDLRDLAYSDAALWLPMGGGGSAASRRGLLRPMHLARMLQGADVLASHRVMVVAGETGYAAALLGHLAALVVTLECDSGLADRAKRSAAGSVGRIEAVAGPLSAGHAALAPYDVILVQGAVETGFDSLLGQLARNGRLISIEPSSGGSNSGRAVRLDRFSDGISRRVLFDATAPVLPDFRRPAAFAF